MTADALAMTGTQPSSTPVGPPPAGRGWRVRLPRFVLLSVLVGTVAATGAHDTPFNPDDPAYIRRQYVWFQSQEPARQQQLRKLHAEFLDLAPDDQARLSHVMQTYNAWLARLPEGDRRRVADAPAGAARLDVVREVREREWVESLPRPYRDEYARLDGDARRQRVAEWRAEEVDRREEWALAQKHWLDNPGGRVPTMFQQGEPRALFEAFVGNLYENLWPAERRELDEARSAADDFGNYFWYAREVVRLADLHPPLPGRVGPKDFAGLPGEVKDYLVKNGRFRKKGTMLAGEDMKELRRAVGRWPDFAVELTRYCQKNNLKLPVPLGDCRKEDMPVDVRQYLEKVLEPQMKKTPTGQADLEALNRTQGSWPEYPRMILDLAKKYKQPVPGWTLPGPSPVWDKLRPGKARVK